MCAFFILFIVRLNNKVLNIISVIWNALPVCFIQFCCFFEQGIVKLKFRSKIINILSSFFFIFVNVTNKQLLMTVPRVVMKNRIYFFLLSLSFNAIFMKRNKSIAPRVNHHHLQIVFMTNMSYRLVS